MTIGGVERNMEIWVDGWQMQCCGDSFSPGSRVDWMVSEGVDFGFLRQFLPNSELAGITHAEERHSEDDQTLVKFRRDVVGIKAVFGGFAPSAPGSKTMVPIPDSGVIDSRTLATGWEEESLYERTFLGYIVEVAEP